MKLHQISLGKKLLCGGYALSLVIVECTSSELFVTAPNEIIYNTTDNVLMHMGCIIPRYKGDITIDGYKVSYTFSGDVFTAKIDNSFYGAKSVIIPPPEEKEIVEVIKEVPVEVVKEVVKDNVQVIKGEFIGTEFNIPNYKPSNGILVLKLANGNNISNYTVTGGGKVKILAQIKDTDTVYYEVTKIKSDKGTPINIL